MTTNNAINAPVSTFMATVLDDADASAARATLAAAASGANSDIASLSALNGVSAFGGNGGFYSPPTDAKVMTLGARDIDGSAYKDFVTFTSGNTPTAAFTQPAGGTMTWNGGAIGGTTPAAGFFTGLTLSNTGALRGLPSTSSFTIDIYDTDESTYRSFITASAQAVPTMDIAAPPSGELNVSSTRLSTTESLIEKSPDNNTGASITIDPVNGSFWNLTVDSNTTITVAASVIISNQTSNFGAKIAQNGTGGFTVAFSGVTWISGAPPTMPTAAGAFIVCSFQAINGLILGSVGLQPSDSLILSSLTLTSGLIGKVNGTAAPAGDVGENLSSTLVIGSATSLVSGTAKTVVSASVTGDFDAWATLGFIAAAGTLPTILEGSLSVTTNTQATSPNGGAYCRHQLTFPAGSTQVFPVGMTVVNTSTGTNIFLVATGTFTVSTMTVYGTIQFRRRT